MQQKNQILLFIGLVVIALISRWVPHPPNFSPLLAVALFGGAILSSKHLAVALPLLAIFMSDLVLGFYPMMVGVYACLALVAFAGMFLKSSLKGSWKKKALSFVGGSVVASLVFFVTSNFLVWGFSGMYVKSFAGLMKCYALALPFFHNSLISTLLYSAVLFVSYEYLTARFTDKAVAKR